MKRKKNETEEEEFPSSFKDRAKKFRDIINKTAGMNVAFNLSEQNPTEVKKWISTNSYVIDRIICREFGHGKVAGIPMGKISMICGLQSTGKSYMSIQIAANAMKEGIDVIYFDSEASISPQFVNNVLSKYGHSVDEVTYVQATSLEFVMETIENMLSTTNKPLFFILDSLANTPTKNTMEGSFDPLQSIAEKARILTIAFSKLVTPLANHDSAFLLTNQLKTNISTNYVDKLQNPYFMPGGKAPLFNASLILWLTVSKRKLKMEGNPNHPFDCYIMDENGERIGSEISCKIEKSRFGTEGREIDTKILWGANDIVFKEEETFLDVIKGSDSVEQSGAWTTMKYEDGTEEKFSGKSFVEKMNESEKFKNRVLQLVDEVLLK